MFADRFLCYNKPLPRKPLSSGSWPNSGGQVCTGAALFSASTSSATKGWGLFWFEVTR